MPNLKKQINEKENPVKWPDNCKICDFRLDMSIHDAKTLLGKITCFNFLIQNEYNFISNMFDKEDFEVTVTLKF